MKLRLLLCALCALCGSPLSAQRLIDNLQLGGSSNQVKSGATLTVVAGGTFAYAAGANFDGSASEFRTDIGLAIGTNVQAYDSDLTAIAALTTTSFGRAFLTIADAAALRTYAGLGTIATAAAGDYATAAHGHALSALTQSGATSGQVAAWNGTAWAPADQSGGFASPMTTAGDIIVGGTAGAATRLGIGSDGQVLKVVSGALAYAADSTGGAGGGSLTLARFTALSNQPPATAYATIDTRNAIAVLDFDAATAESAVFVGIVPDGANFTTGLTVRIVWSATSATSGNVIWTAAIERGDTDLDADSFATGLDSAAAAANATSGIVTVTSIDFTGAQVDSIAAGDLFRVKLTRKAADAADTMTGDAELLAVELRQR